MAIKILSLSLFSDAVSNADVLYQITYTDNHKLWWAGKHFGRMQSWIIFRHDSRVYKVRKTMMNLIQIDSYPSKIHIRYALSTRSECDCKANLQQETWMCCRCHEHIMPRTQTLVTDHYWRQCKMLSDNFPFKLSWPKSPSTLLLLLFAAEVFSVNMSRPPDKSTITIIGISSCIN